MEEELPEDECREGGSEVQRREGGRAEGQDGRQAVKSSVSTYERVAVSHSDLNSDRSSISANNLKMHIH